ncbi:hypothetical protein lerEdw1_016712, partial [Lerista edwardsae]
IILHKVPLLMLSKLHIFIHALAMKMLIGIPSSSSSSSIQWLLLLKRDDAALDMKQISSEEALFTTLTVNLSADAMEESRDPVFAEVMGCGTSTTTSPVNKSERAIKAAILIQRWFRSYMVRLKMRRQYALSIFQSIEYAEEQAQLQLSNFFTFMLDHFTQPSETGQDMNSHFFSSASDPSAQGLDMKMREYESTIQVPSSYYGPRLCFPLTVADTDALLQAFKRRQASSELKWHSSCAVVYFYSPL